MSPPFRPGSVKDACPHQGLAILPEAETPGIQTLLNHGHPTGHALESSTEYGRLLHGAGVSVGMTGAAQMECEPGMVPREARRSIASRGTGPTSPPALR